MGSPCHIRTAIGTCKRVMIEQGQEISQNLCLDGWGILPCPADSVDEPAHVKTRRRRVRRHSTTDGEGPCETVSNPVHSNETLFASNRAAVKLDP